MTFNSHQWRATNPEASCWVMASAGTGKTKVLIDRILRLLLEGNNPAHILCLTYTKAAAMEMRERLLAKVQKWQSMDESDLKIELFSFTQNSVSEEFLRAAQTLFDMLNETPLCIQTIHSFCQSLLSAFAPETGISPSFRLLDEREKTLIQNEVCSEILRSDALKESLIEISKFVSENYLRAILIEAMNERLRLACYKSSGEKIADFLDQYYVPKLSENEWLDARNMCHSAFENGPKNLKEAAQKIVCDDEKNLENLYAFFLTKEGEVRKKFTLAANNSSFDEATFQEMGQRVKGAYESQNAQEILILNTHINSCITAAIQCYQNLKRLQSVVDFDDLLLNVRDLLQSNQGWIFEKIDFRLDHILIDEAQDTSRVQWDIIKGLLTHFFDKEAHNKKPRTLFVVGDPKQSIYSFQGADPKHFLEVKEYFENLATYSQQAFDAISLDLCYRQSPQVLQLVDQVFAPFENSKNLLTESVSHTSFRADVSGFTYHLPVTEEAKKIEEKPWTICTGTAPQKSLHSEKIKDLVMELLEKGDVLPSTQKAICPEDIMILFQRRSHLMRDVHDGLKDPGIPCSSSHQGNFLTQLPILDLLALLKFIVLPEDDFNLACLLRSPLFSISESALQCLCVDRKKSLFQSFFSTKENDEVLRILTEYIDLAKRSTSLFNLCHRIIYDISPVMMDHFGDGVMDLFEEFLNHVLEASTAQISSIDELLTYLKNASSGTKNQNRVGVNLMTVHGSKGLESPVVILADATINLVNAQNSLIFSKDFYFLRTSHTPLKKLKDIEKENDIAESHRLLYVALTRAKDYIFVTGEEKNKQESWYDLCLPHTKLFEQKSSVDWQQKLPKKEDVNISHLPIRKDLTAAPRLSSTKTEKSKRGEAIHKLIEHKIWNLSESALQTILKKPLFSLLDSRDVEKIQMLPHHLHLGKYLAKNYHQEAEIFCADIGLQRLDYLLVEDEKITIIDFKTTQSPPESVQGIEAATLKQLQIYKEALWNLYPSRSISTFVFYTENEKLLEIENEDARFAAVI